MYMTGFSEPCLKNADTITKGLKQIYEDKKILENHAKGDIESWKALPIATATKKL